MRLSFTILFAGCLLFNSGFSAPVPNGCLDIHFIDVGYGDSILVQSPSGRFLLIDSGYPEAEKKLLDYLRKEKVNILDYFIITHPHPDHLGTAVKVLNNFKVLNLRDNGQPINRFDNNLTRELVFDYQNKFREHPYYQNLTEGDVIKWGKVKLEILWPPSPFPSSDWNTNSLVIMLRYEGFNALLAADINLPGEKELLKKQDKIFRAHLLKVGHHGAGDATGPDFLQSISPKCAVISVGENPWGYPSAVVITRLKEAGIEIYRTDRDGSIHLQFCPGEGIKITTTGETG